MYTTGRNPKETGNFDGKPEKQTPGAEASGDGAQFFRTLPHGTGNLLLTALAPAR